MDQEATPARAFLFTDLESSTQLWERHPEQMRSSLARHDAILRAAVERAGGAVVKTTGDGLMAVFDDATSAVAAAVDAQRGLAQGPWEETGQLRVRMGVHWGHVQVRDEDYFGPTVNRTARIMSAGHGGQVLLSAVAESLVADHLPTGVVVRDLGEHRLKDLAAPEQLFQLVVEGLADRFPPLVTLDRVVNNLPTQTTPFLGRGDQVAELRAALDDPAVRLVSLTGPGGTGKTRLALQAAADQVDRYLDGVYVVDLSPDHDADAAIARIVRTVSVTLALDERPLEALKKDLGTRHVLLVLDSCEQVQGLGAAAAQLLAACPRLTLLATSREPLHVRGERAYPVPPMAVPEPDVTPSTALEAEAVRLFVDRALASHPGFVLDDSTVADVVAICRRLDGLPLALELAAARLRLFAPAELLSRLGLQLLRGGPTDLPDRQQTLRATIDWSYELLDDDERELFLLLSVFADADVPAVEAVAERCGLAARVDVIDGLDSLLSKSLLRAVPSARGRSRVGMLQTIREYAGERLDSAGNAAATKQAHAAYFADMVAEVRSGLSGPSRADQLSRLEADLGNAQEAWRYFVTARDADRLRTMLEGLWALHQSRGWYHGAVDLADDLLGLLAGLPQTPELIRQQVDLQTSLARALMALNGYTDEVEAAFDRALSLSGSAATTSTVSRIPVLRSLAGLHQMRMEFPLALSAGQELLALAEGQDDPVMSMDAHLVVGSSLAFLDQPEEGLRHLDKAIELFQPSRMSSSGLSVGAHPGVVSLTTSALLMYMLGRPEEAMSRASRAEHDSQQLGHPFTRAYALFHTAYLDLVRQDLNQMGRRADELLSVANANDYAIWRALSMLLQSIAQIARGEPDAGIERMSQAMTLYRSTSAPPVFWSMVLGIRAGGLTMAGRARDALAIADEALRITPDVSPFFGEAALQLADVMLVVDPSQVEEARRLYASAVKISHAMRFRMSELRAATRLVRVARTEAERAEAVGLLRLAHQTFTEGFGLADLQAATAELEM